jgi:hypothetical protein
VQGKSFVSGGERWNVEEDATAATAVAVYPTYGSYESQSGGTHTIVFVHPVSQKKRYADWLNPLSMCDIGDLQIMFAGSRTRR